MKTPPLYRQLMHQLRQWVQPKDDRHLIPKDVDSPVNWVRCLNRHFRLSVELIDQGDHKAKMRWHSEVVESLSSCFRVYLSPRPLQTITGELLQDGHGDRSKLREQENRFSSGTQWAERKLEV